MPCIDFSHFTTFLSHDFVCQCVYVRASFRMHACLYARARTRVKERESSQSQGVTRERSDKTDHKQLAVDQKRRGHGYGAKPDQDDGQGCPPLDEVGFHGENDAEEPVASDEGQSQDAGDQRQHCNNKITKQYYVMNTSHHPHISSPQLSHQFIKYNAPYDLCLLSVRVHNYISL